MIPNRRKLSGHSMMSKRWFEDFEEQGDSKTDHDLSSSIGRRIERKTAGRRHTRARGRAPLGSTGPRRSQFNPLQRIRARR